MKMCINEKEIIVEQTLTLGQIADLYKPGADLLILNGFPASSGVFPCDGDTLFLIKRGEIPSSEELEATMAARHTPGVHQKLKRAVVGIAGVGGLGSAVAVALARVGVGRLVVADFDLVEPSNLNRQQYFVDQIGLPKVEALVANIVRINPYVTLIPHATMLDPYNIPSIFSECSVVVEAFDRAEMKAMLVETILSGMTETTVVAASGMAGYVSGNSIVSRKITDRLYLVGDGTSAAEPGNGLMAPRVGIAACHQANQVIRILLGEDEP